MILQKPGVLQNSVKFHRSSSLVIEEVQIVCGSRSLKFFTKLFHHFGCFQRLEVSQYMYQFVSFIFFINLVVFAKTEHLSLPLKTFLGLSFTTEEVKMYRACKEKL